MYIHTKVVYKIHEFSWYAHEKIQYIFHCISDIKKIMHHFAKSIMLVSQSTGMQPMWRSTWVQNVNHKNAPCLKSTWNSLCDPFSSIVHLHKRKNVLIIPLKKVPHRSIRTIGFPWNEAKRKSLSSMEKKIVPLLHLKIQYYFFLVEL